MRQTIPTWQAELLKAGLEKARQTAEKAENDSKKNKERLAALKVKLTTRG